MTTDELSKVENAYRKAVRRSEDLRKARNIMIRRALAEGWTHAKIAKATGLTRGRIGQLASIEGKS